ncbi:steroid receptor-associated and regulated protein [Ochotona princeps]|uniref:steroid receptor-associated and regulated protein n=1 Tax=Ochotona princeps TaxID=9978 RepID=UPI0027144B37|nr:steroid receptor-associated and regulated protein [Ochotona princeps]
MASSEDSRDCGANLRDPSIGTHLETSSGEKPNRPQKAIPKAHVTFLVDCTRGERLLLPATPMAHGGWRPPQSPAMPPMKTYMVFCGESTAQKMPLESGLQAQPPCKGVKTPDSSAVGSLCPQEVSSAKGNPSKGGPGRSSTWGTVKGSLKALSSCVCGQAD